MLEQALMGWKRLEYAALCWNWLKQAVKGCLAQVGWNRLEWAGKAGTGWNMLEEINRLEQAKISWNMLKQVRIGWSWLEQKKIV